MIRQRRRAFRPVLDALDDRLLLSTLTPQQVKQAYGLNAITFSSNGTTASGDGSGQTIAIVDAYHDPNLAADLSRFDAAFGLSNPSLTVINQAGGVTDDGWTQEEALDVEWAHAIAPGANIVVVEARSDNLSDLVAAVNTAKSIPSVSTVSMSWGSAEFAGQTSLDSTFTTPAGHQGITFVAAAGDGGLQSGAQWPASSANVLAVGGTSLYVSASGAYQRESPWAGSGGGYSRFVSEPSYQATLQTSGVRTAADVAFDADPATGVAVYATLPSTGVGSWYQVGGTSLGAPAWAAIVAIADQGRGLSGLGTLDGATQTLPALYSLPSSDFHAQSSVTSTGLGTPNGASLVSDLAFGPSASGATSTPANTVTIASTTPTSTTTTAPTPTKKHKRVKQVRRRRTTTHHATTTVARHGHAPSAAQATIAHDAAIEDVIAEMHQAG